ncbi:MAG: SIMPL domain-containing protein [Prevotellaceae bacterium]|nr:SIMPL domain-containing protein [Prevotellaceae bacterium]
MKKVLFLIAALIIFAAVAMPAKAQSEVQPTIEVTGSATIHIVPNHITIEIGMEEYFKPTASGDSVIVKLTETEKDVRWAIRSAGVPDSLIVVADMGNYINRDRSENFLMAKRLSVSVTSLEQAERISEKLGRKGITSFNITKIDNTDMERYNREGLKAALDAARKKAEFIAENESARIIMPIEIVENASYYGIPAMSNVSFDGGAGIGNMRRIIRNYSVKVKYIFSKD